jgi:hypothetical protein
LRVAFNASGREATRNVKMDAAALRPARGRSTAAGPEASISDESSGRTHTIRHEHRATLLYMLAKQFAADTRRRARELAGWCADDESSRACGGRATTRRTASPRSSRIRNELKLAGSIRGASSSAAARPRPRAGRVRRLTRRTPRAVAQRAIGVPSDRTESAIAAVRASESSAGSMRIIPDRETLTAV